MLRSLFSGGVIRRYALHARLLWHSAPLFSVLSLLLTLIVAAAGTAALITTGRLVAALPDPDATWFWLAATAVVFVAGPVATAALAATAQAVEARYLVSVLDLTMEAGTNPYGIAHLEHPREAADLDAVAKAPNDWLFIAGIHSGWTLLAIRLGGVGAFVVLAGWRCWVPILLLAGWFVLSKGFSQWSRTIFDDLLHVAGHHRRYAHYLRSVLTGAAAAKEIRPFGLTDWLIGRYTTAWYQAMHAVWTYRSRGMRKPCCSSLSRWRPTPPFSCCWPATRGRERWARARW